MKEGKEYIHYLVFFATYLSVRNEEDIKLAWRYIVLLALYYVFIEVCFILGAYKLNLFHYLYRKDASLGIVKVYQPIFLIVFLALFYQLWKSTIQKTHNYFQLVFLFLAGLLTAFRSYILGSFISLAAIYITAFRGEKQRFIKVCMLYGLIIFISFSMLSITFSDSITKRFATTFDNYIFSGVREFVTQKGGALEGRYSVNKFRWDYFSKRSLLGYGFIDKFSALGKKIFLKHRAELMMIDTGYLDVLLKFGIIGAIIFYGVFLRILFILAKIVRHSRCDEIRVQAATLFCFLTTMLAAQVTHSGLTFSFGIVPLALGMGLLDSKVYLLRQEKKLIL